MATRAGGGTLPPIRRLPHCLKKRSKHQTRHSSHWSQERSAYLYRALPPMLSVLPFYIHFWSFLVFGHFRPLSLTLEKSKRTLILSDLIWGARLSDNKACHLLSIAWIEWDFDIGPGPAVRPKNCEFQETELVSGLLDTFSQRLLKLPWATFQQNLRNSHKLTQLSCSSTQLPQLNNSHNRTQLAQLNAT